MQRGQRVAGCLAVLHRVAQGGLDHVDSGGQFVAAGFGGQQLGLHAGNLRERRVETFLRGDSFGGAHIAFVADRVQAVLKQLLVEFCLIAEVARADRIHDNDGRGDDGPTDDGCHACVGDKLHFGFEADKTRIGIGFEEDTSFGKESFQSCMYLNCQPCPHAVLLVPSHPGWRAFPNACTTDHCISS